MRTRYSLIGMAGLVMALPLAATSARAQNGTWTNTQSGAWSDASNWLGGIVATGATGVADFSAINVTNDVTIYLDSARTNGSLVFGDADTNSAAGWSLAATNTLTLGGPGAPAPITVGALAAGQGVTISAPIDLGYKDTDVNVAAGGVLVISSNVTTAVLTDTVQFRMFGPGVCRFSGQVFKPTDPGLRQIHVKGGRADFVDARVYCTALDVGYFTSANAYVSMTDSTLIINPGGQWWGRIEVGGSGAVTSVDVRGGTLSVPGNVVSILGYTGQRGKAILSLHGGAQVNASRLLMGEVDYNRGEMVVRDADLFFPDGMQVGGAKGAGVIHQLGGTVTSGAPLSMQYRMGQSSAWGIYTLIGGVLSCTEIHSGDGTTGFVRNNTYFNFHGGTLRPAGPNADFIRTTITGPNAGIAAPRANVYSGGAVIDTVGYDIAINQPLLAPSGQGVTNEVITLPPGSKGAGYEGAPVLIVNNASGDATGVGATAIANMVDDGSGNGTFAIDSVMITCPGFNYTDTPAIDVFGGDPATPAAIPALSIAPNISGGLTKLGLGTLTLSATNTYTGDTIVGGGTLANEHACLADEADLYIAKNATLAIEFDGEDVINALYVNDVAIPKGKYYSGDLGTAILGSGSGCLKVTSGSAAGLQLLVR